MFSPCFISVCFQFILFYLSLEVVTSVKTSPCPFYFVFVPSVASNREEVRFGEVAVLKQIYVLPQKTNLSARTPDCFEIVWAHAPDYCLTIISFELFDLSNRIFSKKINLYLLFCFDRFLPITAFAS